MPRRPYLPTEEHRRHVSNAAQAGSSHSDIAKSIRVSLPTLYKYYRKELDEAWSLGNVRIRQTMYKLAVVDQHPGMLQYLGKTRLGDTEVHKHEVAIAPKLEISFGKQTEQIKASSTPAHSLPGPSPTSTEGITDWSSFLPVWRGGRWRQVLSATCSKHHMGGRDSKSASLPFSSQINGTGTIPCRGA